LNTIPGDTTERFRQVLAAIEAEAPQVRTKRWQGLFDQLAGPNAKKLVLFGAGQFGVWVLQRLRKVGIELAASLITTDLAGEAR